MPKPFSQDAINQLTSTIIGAAIRVHRELGPGLLENAYLACLCLLLTRTGLRLETQKALPLVFEGVRIDCAYRADLFVEALDALAPVHLRQRRLSTIFAPPILAIECQSPPPSLRPHQAQHPWLIT